MCATVEQTVSLLPLLLNVSLLALFPQACKQPAENDANEERESEQDVEPHWTLPSP